MLVQENNVEDLIDIIDIKKNTKLGDKNCVAYKYVIHFVKIKVM